MVIDFHTHAFPDALAERAMAALLAGTTDVQAAHDGRLSSLLASMDHAGIHRAVLCSIATRPEQYEKIFAWSGRIRSDRIVPLPSVHPRDPLLLDHLDAIARDGFRGIKLHPYYQEFVIDDAALDPLYARLSDLGLLVVCHTGFDIAFPRVRRADPARVARVVARFPDLTFVATHLGGWSDWDEVRLHLTGKPVYMELSYALGEMPPATARALILDHPADRILFGTDSPWQDQAETLARLRALDLGPAREQAILSENALRLLSGSTAAAHASLPTNQPPRL